MTGSLPKGRPPSLAEGGRPGPCRWWLGAAALSIGAAAVTGAGAAVLVGPKPHEIHVRDTGTVPVHAEAGPVTHAPSGSPAPRPAAPVRVRIPSIDLDEPLTGLRVQQDGHLAVPADPAQAGWWSDGPRPGENGAAVLVGHLDSAHGPAAFYNVSALRPGARINVTRGDGSTAGFTVRALRQYAKDAVPDSQVYATTGPPALRLITCGGTYEGAGRGYRDNLVVFATLTH
ncbi:class F sortase [Streptomyces sp. NPDC088923]|uniref:class F sortase n=1 Tax=Streptomyces sp. NPDC088923 TaxID=3365913 RepID=UPI0037F1F9DD